MKMKMEKMKILSVSLILSVKLRGSPNFVPFFVIGRKEGNGKGETRSKHISKESWSCKGREKGEGVSFPSTNFSRNEGRNSFKENLINDAPGLQTSCDIIEVATDATFALRMQNSQDSNESFKRRNSTRRENQDFDLNYFQQGLLEWSTCVRSLEICILSSDWKLFRKIFSWTIFLW